MEMDYFTKWVKFVPVKKTISKVVCNFLKENILVKFRVPANILIDNAQNFSSSEIQIFFYENGIQISHSSDYFP